MAREHYSINGEAAKIALGALESAKSSMSNGYPERARAWAEIATAAARLVDATKG